MQNSHSYVAKKWHVEWVERLNTLADSAIFSVDSLSIEEASHADEPL